MTDRAFRLHPFGSDPACTLQLTGIIGRQQDQLSLRYELVGDLSQVRVPPIGSALPQRQHHLWQATCFEFFLGLPDCDPYWEFNLSPAGHWNVYRFDSYRQGMREEHALDSLPFTVQQTPNTLCLQVTVDLTVLLTPGQSLAVGVSTVIQAATGKVTYWALTHPAKAADFHWRDGFSLNI